MSENKPSYIIKPNPDAETFKEVSEAVKDNDNYCCCELVKTEDTKCMCKNFRDMDEGGFCHCGRFYKVVDYPTITIICAPDDHDHALDLAYYLSTEGFVVTLPMYQDALHFMQHEKIYRDLQRTKIHKANLVFVINSSETAMEFLEEEIYWAEELHKKIVYEHNEEVKE